MKIAIFNFSDVVGDSPAIMNAISTAKRLAKSNSTI